jgi:hypothetical protein
MAFPRAHNVDISEGVVNDVGNDQYNCIFQLAPLESAFSTAGDISSLVQRVEGSREQLQALAASINTLLRTIDSEYCAGRLLEANTSLALEHLAVYVRHRILISDFSLTKTPQSTG